MKRLRPYFRAQYAVFPAIALFIAGAFSGCVSSGAKSEKTLEAPRLVILYAPCTVNKSFLSPYNSAIVFTPSLDSFARGSAVFRKHQTEAGQSGTAYASIFTATQADDHGIYYHPVTLGEESYLITEAFSENGYELFFWNDQPMASAALGYGQGVSPDNVHQRLLVAADPRFLEILDRMDADPEYRAFVVANFTVSHDYKTENLARFLQMYPEESRGLSVEEIQRNTELYLTNRLSFKWDFPNTVRQLELSASDVSRMAEALDIVYRSRIHRLDGLFGDLVSLLDSRGLLDVAMTVFTADHGEFLFRDNALFKWTHGLELTPEVLGVPLIISSPRVPPQVRSKVTRSIDVFPTMAGLADVHIGPQGPIRHVDLSTELITGEPLPKLVAFSHGTVAGALRKKEMRKWELHQTYFPQDGADRIWTSALTNDLYFRWRSRRNREWGMEVFDLSADPEMRNDLFDETEPEHRGMTKMLIDYKKHLVDRYVGPGNRRKQSLSRAARLEALRSLGYVD